MGGTLSGGEQRLDPVEAALTWVKSGARWIHLVDLDLAFGRGTNTEVLAEVVAAVRANARMTGSARFVFRSAAVCVMLRVWSAP